MVIKLVVDSSVIVKWINTTDEENLDQANKILADALQDKVKLLTTELAKYEVGNVLLLRKKVSLKNSEIPLHTLFNLPVQFIPESEKSAKETYYLASNLGITCYDASFLAVAKQYDAALVTENVKRQGKTSEVKVIALKDY